MRFSCMRTNNGDRWDGETDLRLLNVLSSRLDLRKAFAD